MAIIPHKYIVGYRAFYKIIYLVHNKCNKQYIYKIDNTRGNEINQHTLIACFYILFTRVIKQINAFFSFFIQLFININRMPGLFDVVHPDYFCAFLQSNHV
jgi:uncharacterized protein with ParB-like and HNH nuclease domain